MIGLIEKTIENYLSEHTSSQSRLLDDLYNETYKSMDMPQMLCGHIEGRFLKMLVQLIKAKNILEIGTFTGFSCLSMAEGLPADGKIITCDINPKSLAIAKKYIDKSPYAKNIEIREGDALKTIDTLDVDFDMVFIDADKPNYFNYFKKVLPKLKTGGLIVVDNTLWAGEVLSPKSEDAVAINDFNNKIMKYSYLDVVMTSIRDGVTLIRKNG